eukprot:COSAG01_NODE_70028_length_259_cov_2.518750_1_plen_75_part_01
MFRCVFHCLCEETSSNCRDVAPRYCFFEIYKRIGSLRSGNSWAVGAPLFAAQAQAIAAADASTWGWAPLVAPNEV